MPYRNVRVSCVLYLLTILRDIELVTRKFMYGYGGYVSSSNLGNVHKLIVLFDMTNKDNNMFKFQLGTIRSKLDMFIKKLDMLVGRIIKKMSRINK
ncbi:hypothetical protein [Borrelia persica]|uniref:hypothetical protein n=1 Tax=Borrelia persica TaxID=44448 RepID=UPI0004669B1B|nr:hypothetical protein [Borrelia persica]